MAFTNLFRRHSTSIECPRATYACVDASSIAETLLDELETHCQNSLLASVSKSKRNSEAFETSGGLLSSTYSSSPIKRHASVDYSWLTPQTNLLQTGNELYHLSDIIKMELSELIRNVSPEDCTHIVNQFRREIRSQPKGTTPENIIALFRKTLAEYIEHKSKHRSNSNEAIRSDDGSHSSSKTISSLTRCNRVLPKNPSEDELQSIAELAQISISSSATQSKPRSNTYT